MIACRFLVPVALGCAAGLAVGPAASAATQPGPEVAAAASGTQLWASRYPGPAAAAGTDQADAAAVRPGGGTVFVTGAINAGGGRGTVGYGTVAYKAATGARLWARVDGGDGHAADAVAVNPSGTEVFVAGQGDTVAYRASTGTTLWASRYGAGNSIAYAVAVSPDGSAVFVTGSAPRPGGGDTYYTVAYRAAAGATLWTRRYSGPDRTGIDDAYSVAVSPDGTKVFVTGDAQLSNTVPVAEFATVAYNAASGAQLWARQYRSNGAFARASSLAVSPDGSKVVVTGPAGLSNGMIDYQTIAYRAATGTQVWAARYASSGGVAEADTVAVSPDTSRVFVTGWSVDGIGRHYYTTVAYHAATGTQLWVGRYSGIYAYQLAVSPDGSKVFVTGQAPGAKPGATDYGTVAYNAATGAQEWARRYGTTGADTARAVVASKAGVFVTGYIGYSCGFRGLDTCYKYETVAYQP